MKISRFLLERYQLIKIQLEYRGQLRLLNKVIDLGEEIIDSKKIVWDKDDYFKIITTYFLARTIQRTKAIKILLIKGLGQDASVLIRAQFEDFVDFGYILKDKGEAEKFFNYGLKPLMQITKVLLESDSPKITAEKRKQLESQLTKFEEKWESVKGDYADPGNWWREKTLKDKCDDLGLGETYGIAYRYQSQFVHPSSAVMDRYILGSKGEDVVVEIGASGALLDECFSATMAIQLDFLAALDRDFALGFTERIARLTEVLKK